MVDPDLLRPSVKKASVVGIYSLRAAFYTSFFGGPFAAILIHWRNAELLDRQERDRWAFAAALVLALAFYVAAIYASVHPELLAGLPEELQHPRTIRWTSRLVALTIWGGLYFRMHDEYRAAGLRGAHLPAWRAGLWCVGVGTVASIALITVFTVVFKAI